VYYFLDVEVPNFREGKDGRKRRELNGLAIIVFLISATLGRPPLVAGALVTVSVLDT